MQFGYKQLYIEGMLRDAANAGRHRHICPATQETVAELAWATSEDANTALQAAQAALPAWSGLTLEQRVDWMICLRDAIAREEEYLRHCVMYEMGKPWAATAEDFQTLVKALEWYPAAMQRLTECTIPDDGNRFTHRIISKPVGVVVAILAWNFPLLNLAFKLGPALAVGCTIVVKPSEKSALSAYAVGEIAAKIDFPRGVFNILCGPTEDVGKTLSSSRIPRLLTMIGSSVAGRKLIAQGSTSIKRMSMELGGNAPALVFADADLEKAAKDIAALKFGNSGQICVSPNRIFVQKEAMPEFARLLEREANAVRIGFGKEAEISMGPMIDEPARQRVDGLVKNAIEEGAQVLCGGRVPPGMQKGFYYEPTILTGVRGEMRLCHEEIFGPVAALLSFEREEEALQAANDTDYGLVAFLYTADGERAGRLTDQLEFGEIMINGFKYGIDLPHGGIKESGVGKDCSEFALDDYLVKVRVTTAR